VGEGGVGCLVAVDAAFLVCLRFSWYLVLRNGGSGTEAQERRPIHSPFRWPMRRCVWHGHQEGL
jgi:hypothetical protein